MTAEERKVMNDLCKRILAEKNLAEFHQLVEQLDELCARNNSVTSSALRFQGEKRGSSRPRP
jgi:hypothetical protein